MDNSHAFQNCLEQLGFQYDPFAHLNAAEDPHVGDYLVGHRAFSIAWDDAPAVVFAAAGGGKTAMRIYVGRSCWTGLHGIGHPLPVPYLPASVVFEGNPPTAEQHLTGIMTTIAKTLLIVITHMPQLFLQNLNIIEQSRLVYLWNKLLQWPIEYYLGVLCDGTAHELGQSLDPTYLIPQSNSDTVSIQSFCDTVLSLQIPSDQESLVVSDWIELIDLTKAIGFRSIFLLVDGVDALPETIHDAKATATQVDWLLAQAPLWQKTGVILKCFLPSETESPLRDTLVNHGISYSRLEWTPDLLADVIRRRIYAATNGEYGSLDAICAASLRDVDTRLAKQVIPLPREIVVLTRYVLQALFERTGGNPDHIEPEDIEDGLLKYRQTVMQIFPPEIACRLSQQGTLQPSL